MKAAVLDGVDSKFKIVEVDLAGPKAGEVLVKISASGLCASDLNAIDGKRKLVPFPAVIGHEAAGVVLEVGEGVTRIKVGDHVILSIVPSCGACEYCQSGRPNYCSTAGDAMGVGGLFDGTSRLTWNGEHLNHFLTVASFAEYAVVPESGAVVIPKEMPLDRAALISCAVITGYGAAINTAKVKAGSRVAVFGCGGVGLNILQGARMAGAKRIIAVDVSDEKLELARKVGATDVINAKNVDPVIAIKELTGGVDYAFEALGREETIAQAWSTVDVSGSLTLVGLLKNGARLTFDAGPFVNEQSIKGCYFGSANLQRDVTFLVESYLSGELFLDELISRRIGLEDLNGAFDQLREGEGARSVLVFD
ncbi:MAG: Zn-dependent alcohol dehydrogenase [Candidatus Nanopelagicaceae bacterium]|nr:Zn-dependent alcohol dehydrogenase [Candidatus Nanopelagicaceae bacterium]